MSKKTKQTGAQKSPPIRLELPFEKAVEGLVQVKPKKQSESEKRGQSGARTAKKKQKK